MECNLHKILHNLRPCPSEKVSYGCFTAVLHQAYLNWTGSYRYRRARGDCHWWAGQTNTDVYMCLKTRAVGFDSRVPDVKVRQGYSSLLSDIIAGVPSLNIIETAAVAH